MQEFGLNRLRSLFLNYFESKGHLKLDSFSLIPQQDKSLLLINSGMAPMKQWFLRQQEPPRDRVTTCQKCIRTPDIERVGKTARHGTFFEMLGNFSFGDYFKKEAIHFAWEFLTQVLEIPTERLYVSIYENDEEAYQIWKEQEKVALERIVRLGKEDNFWEIGSGPCGPCSEIYFDRGPEKGCSSPHCGVGCDCDRYVEIWNLVFTQFNSDGHGNYEPMARPNIDTGMGLERLACVMQNVDNLFEVDTVQKIMRHVCRIAHTDYQKDAYKDVCLRVITDHIRGAVFLIADGVVPGNEGREYVLRRLLRRAERNGRQLGITEPFLYEVAQTVIEQNKEAYPELIKNAAYIKKIILAEEENFSKVLKQGMSKLSALIDQLDTQMNKASVLPGKEVFLLCDTYGFPFDLIKDVADELNLTIDSASYHQLLEEQRARARKASQQNQTAWKNFILETDAPKTQFIGYEQQDCEAVLLDVFIDGKPVKEVSGDGFAQLLFDRTPFYAQGGGQVSDKGIFKAGHAIAHIQNCQKTSNGYYIHEAKIISGALHAGMKGTLSINHLRREAITRNHTAAHLLQKSLQMILGDHVRQAGQLVDDERVRFDFHHFSSISPEELSKIEGLVNEKILAGLPVHIYETDLESAKKRGAMALFGEKYGNVVRVVDADGFSIELCGGCHVNNTAKIGLFKILSESSVSAGIRRIEAITGYEILEHLTEAQNILTDTNRYLKADNIKAIPEKCELLQKTLKHSQQQIDRLTEKIIIEQIKSRMNESTTLQGIKVITADFKDLETSAFRAAGDYIKGQDAPAVALFTNYMKDKTSFLVAASKSAVKKGVHAGNIVRQIAAYTGGKGGGRPDSAMAGAGDAAKAADAVKHLPEIIKNL